MNRVLFSRSCRGGIVSGPAAGPACKNRRSVWVACALALSLLLISIPAISADDSDAVIFIKSGSDPFTATLVPDPQPGFVPEDPALVEVTTNDDATPFQLNPGSNGQVDLGGDLPGLQDGRHKAAVTTLVPEGGQKDRKQLLLFVDSKPPMIEMMDPEGTDLPRTATSFRFRVTDPANGSGVAPDPRECGLQVSVSNAVVRQTSFTYEGSELHLLVIFNFSGGAAQHDSSVAVSVSLRDRAGNEGRYAGNYAVDGLVAPAFKILKCSPEPSYLQTASEFLVEPAFAAIDLASGETRELQFTTRGYAGKDHVYPNEFIQQREGTTGIEEIFTMNTFFQKAVGDRITITSDSTNLDVHKIPDDNFKDSRLAFAISQKNPAPMDARTGSLQVTYPASIQINAPAEDICAAFGGVDSGKDDDNAYYHLQEEVFTYTYKTVTIPVFLETAPDPVQFNVFQQNEQLAARVLFTPIELMDTAASWFSFEGNKYWFEQQGDACVAMGPAREGTLHFKIAAAHKIAEFNDLQGGAVASGRTLFHEGDFIVRMDPPKIENFRYDREKNTLYADINDQGTPLEELRIGLQLSGYPVDFDFDAATGKLAAPLTFMPLSVLTAALSATDLARQTTTESCTVFGEVEPEEEDQPGSTYRADPDTSYVPRENTEDIKRILGTTTDGKTIVEVCEEFLQWGTYQNGQFIPLAGRPESITLVQLFSRNYSPNDASYAISRRLPISMEVFGTSYDTGKWYPAPARSGNATSLTVSGDPSLQGVGQKIYYAVMARDGSRQIPLHNWYNVGVAFKTRKAKQCRVEERDILAPVVRPVYDPATGRVTASIHDHGMPLDQLTIDFSGRNDSRNRFNYSRSLPFQYANGNFSGQFDLPDKGERFNLVVRATDRAGNRGSGKLAVSAPRTSPEVGLFVETGSSSSSISRSSAGTSAYIRAEAEDDSEIVPEKTTLWLDNQVLSPITIYSTGWESQYRFKAGYISELQEGPHLARFRATDAVGLWAEVTQVFDYLLAPIITSFKVMPDAVRKIGGPALTATIIDPGGDLDKNGLTLAIDGQPLDPAILYYDPASGYFAADGPLELADGQHLAELTATDTHGNQADAALRFSRALEITTPRQTGDEGLFLDSIALMELENQNGDGNANPGELVRLFVSLRNDTDENLTCIARLSSEDIDISVETESLPYGNMASGSTLVPMKGFDLRIGADILEKTISDPYDTHMDMRLECEDGQEWLLPFTLPIYQRTLPVDIDSALTVRLDRLPPTTTEESIVVWGNVSSTNSFIEEMTLLVNGIRQGEVRFNREGGRFEVTTTLIEGNNTIEVRAVDETGARGSDAVFIFRTNAFVPPSVTITSPANGVTMGCPGDLIVTGTYDSGSSTVDALTVEVSSPSYGWEAECTVTIIDGTSFSADCGPLGSIPPGANDIEAVIYNNDGFDASDAITIDVGWCS